MGPVDSPAGPINPRDKVHVVIAPFNPRTCLTVVDTDPEGRQLLLYDSAGNFHVVRPIAVAIICDHQA